MKVARTPCPDEVHEAAQHARDRRYHRAITEGDSKVEAAEEGENAAEAVYRKTGHLAAFRRLVTIPHNLKSN